MFENPSAVVTNIQKFSVHDGPGIRSVVFLKGCSLDCMWCSNPENIHPYPELMVRSNRCIGCGRCRDVCSRGLTGVCSKNNASCTNCGNCASVCSSMAREIAGKLMNTDQVLEAIEKDAVFYKRSGGGVTFSGGEALLFPDFVASIAKRCRQQGFGSAIETCGLVPWEAFEKVISFNELFLFDLKLIDRDKHIRYCGKSNDLILNNLMKLCTRSRVIIRVPVIPSVNDSEDDIRKLCSFLSGLDGLIEDVHCLPYHELGTSKYDTLGISYRLPGILTPDTGYMNDIRNKFEKYGIKPQIL